MNTIKIGVVPGEIKEVVIDNAMTVAEIASLAGLETTGYQVRVNGNVVDATVEIGEDATVLLAKQIKGNADYMVKIGVVPGEIKEIAVDGEMTVAEIASIAGLEVQGYQVRVNGNVVDGNFVVEETATVLLAKQIKGN